MDDTDSDFAAGYVEKSLSQLSGGSGRVVLASCAPAETSLILPGAHNSLFTTHLLDALRGKGEPSGSHERRLAAINALQKKVDQQDVMRSGDSTLFRNANYR